MKVHPTPLLNIIFFIFPLLFVTHAAASDLDSFKGMQGNISISGGTAHYPVMLEFKKRVEKYSPEILITVRAGGSSHGIKQVGKGLVDIGNGGRPLKAKEQKQYDLRTIPLAIDALAVIVHPSNPISTLGSDTIKKIFTGEITNWKDVGGVDKPISVYSRETGSGTRSVFTKKMLKKSESTKKAQIAESHNEMKVAVSWDKNAIGYMSFSSIEKTKVKPLSINGVEPKQENILSGKYMLSRKLYMYIPADSAKVSDLTRKFVDFVLGKDNKAVIKEYGYIPLK